MLSGYKLSRTLNLNQMQLTKVHSYALKDVGFMDFLMVMSDALRN